MNRELQNINECFISNKLSLNAKKTKFSIFHKASRRDDLPLVIPKLFINNQVIKRQSSIKFLGILLDENLSWKEHLILTENKIAKNVGVIYKAKPYLNKDSLLALYFSSIHSCINYANLVWGSTHRSNLQKINSQQVNKQSTVIRTGFTIPKNFLSLVKYSMYINLLNTAVFMHKIKNRTASSSFLEKFEQPSHSYSTRFSCGNYRKPQIKLRKCIFRISIRGPAIWNDLVGITEKEIQSYSHFKTKIKRKLLNFENKVTFFNTFTFKKLTHRSID